MTKELDGIQVTRIIEDNHPGMVLDTQGSNIWIQPDGIRAVATLLKQDPDLLLSTLRAITAVDYVEYFEIIYHLLSMKKNQSLVLKLKCFGRDDPVVDSVVDIWKGADLQEREIWDLFGIKFDEHPNMKRILLWEGFDGQPLRKDFLGQEEQKI